MSDEKPKFSFEELLERENGAFFVHTDGSVFTVRGKYIFDEKHAKYINAKMMEGFKEQMKDSDEVKLKEIREAMLNCGICPLRYH